jgi:hypothetical protein
VVELADTGALKTLAVRRAGSIPAGGTKVMMGTWWLSGIICVGLAINSLFLDKEERTSIPSLFLVATAAIWIVGQFFTNSVEALSLSWFAAISACSVAAIYAGFDKRHDLSAILTYAATASFWTGYLFPEFYF